MKHKVFNSELGEKAPEGTQIEFKVTTGRKFYITTDLELKGRGIRQTGDGSDHARGKKTYVVTENVMNKLKAKYNCAYHTIFS